MASHTVHPKGTASGLNTITHNLTLCEHLVHVGPCPFPLMGVLSEKFSSKPLSAVGIRIAELTTNRLGRFCHSLYPIAIKHDGFYRKGFRREVFFKSGLFKVSSQILTYLLTYALGNWVFFWASRSVFSIPPPQTSMHPAPCWGRGPVPGTAGELQEQKGSLRPPGFCSAAGEMGHMHTHGERNN